MSVSLDDMKAHLNVTFSDDDALITSKVAAAQSIVEAELGFVLAEKFTDTIPAALLEAIKQVAAHLYENREAVSEYRAYDLPHSADDIVRNFRNWSFDGE